MYILVRGRLGSARVRIVISLECMYIRVYIYREIDSRVYIYVCFLVLLLMVGLVLVLVLSVIE